MYLLTWQVVSKITSTLQTLPAPQSTEYDSRAVLQLSCSQQWKREAAPKTLHIFFRPLLLKFCLDQPINALHVPGRSSSNYKQDFSYSQQHEPPGHPGQAGRHICSFFSMEMHSCAPHCILPPKAYSTQKDLWWLFLEKFNRWKYCCTAVHSVWLVHLSQCTASRTACISCSSVCSAQHLLALNRNAEQCILQTSRDNEKSSHY